MSEKETLSIRSRNTRKAWVTKAYNNLNHILGQVPIEAIALEEAVTSLETYIKKLELYQDELLDSTLIEEVDVEEEVNQAFSFIKGPKMLLCTGKSTLNDIKMNNEVKSETENKTITNSSQNNNITAKLPKIELAKFGGDVREWISFYDSFKANVNEQNISNVTKFGYLKGLLYGEAVNCIKGIALTSDNYPIALRLLVERYGRTEKIIFLHLQDLLEVSVGNERLTCNVSHLRVLQDNLLTHIRCLEGLGIGGDRFGVILTPLVLSRLPADIRLQWARCAERKEGDLDFLLTFLQSEIQSRDRASTFQTSIKNNEKKQTHVSTQNSVTSLFNKSSTPVKKSGVHRCYVCGDNHWTDKCPELIRLDKTARRAKFMEHRLCLRCCSNSHQAKSCKKVCHSCSSDRHHKLLCTRSEPVLVSASKLENANTILQTINIEVKGKKGVSWANVLFDTGSNTSYVSKSLVDKIKPVLLGSRNLSYQAFGSKGTGKEVNRAVYELTLESSVGKQSIHVTEVPVICTDVYIPSIPSKVLNTLKKKGIEVQLGCTDNNNIDILIGLDNYWSFMSSEVVHIGVGLVAQKSKLGWILSGKLPQHDSFSCQNNTSLVCLEDLSKDSFTAFWDLESLGIRDSPDLNSDPVINQFKSDIVHKNGRYHVSLPWKPGFKNKLQNNIYSAQCRLTSLKTRLAKDPELKNSYHEAFSDMLNRDMIVEVPKNEISCDFPIFYLPHHPVIKKDSLSTKVRPVFDASASTQNGLSLNDCLYPGPSLIPNLPAILLRFRRWRVAVTADIAKAFLQVGINTPDQDVHRFLWDDNGLTRTMRFTRVPFGNKSSPFLLNATLQHHLSTCDPCRVVSELKENLYVDDFLSGNDDSLEACNELRQAQSILNKASMRLDKIGSNSTSISNVAFHELESKHSGQSSQKVLGLRWLSQEDCFTFDTFEFQKGLVITKRVILSTIARLFDPLGFISPVVMFAKCLFQELWKLELDWDSDIPMHIQTKFKNWLYDLDSLNSLKVRRSYTNKKWRDIEKISLHSFGDASEKGYGACVYMVARFEDQSCQSSLVISKARVAPIKTVTLPRLELLGSLLCARLAQFVKSSLSLESIQVFYHTDSMVALGWIKNTSGKLKPFIQNRVDEISSLTKKDEWFHCPGVDNPADIMTRGLLMSELVNSQLWLKGPEFIRLDNPIPETKVKLPEGTMEIDTLQEGECVMISSDCHEINISRWSSFTRAMRIMTWVLRFSFNSSKKREARRSGELTLEELQTGKLKLIRCDQQQSFKLEYSSVKGGKVVSKTSPLYKLSPFMDSDGLLRVQGRLQKSKLGFDEKHPIILSGGHLSLLLVRFQHVLMKHVGINTILVTLRNQYWILGARRLTKKVKKQCIRCQRQDNKACDNPFAPLPEPRITPSPPFSVIGIDHTGVLFCSDFPSQKFYILLTTCAVIRAVHLELVESLSTQDVMLALRRVFSRRGLASIIFSDNAKAFNKVKELLIGHLGPSAPKWNFIAPKAPWWGGWWERLNHPIKNALKKSIGLSSCTRTELETVLVEIEACINSRPLTFVGDDISNENPLTPAHFLMGRCPMVPCNPSNLSLSRGIDAGVLVELRNEQISILEEFWSIWSKQYLRNLPTSLGSKRNSKLSVGSVVLVHEQNNPRLKWPLAIVIRLHTGKDGLVRAVDLKTSTGKLTRPIQLLHQLELADESSISEDDNPNDGVYNVSFAPNDRERLVEKKSSAKINESSAELNNLTRVGRKVVPPKKFDL